MNTFDTITIDGAEVDLQWGERDADGSLGLAVSTCKTDAVGESGPSDGETFELRGQKYVLGQHNYSTDQPGNEDDEECTCTAEIYAARN